MFTEIVTVLFATILLYLLASYISHVFHLRSYPNGPFPLPIIGNLNVVGTKFHEICYDLSKTHGNVFSLSFGMKRVVIVNCIEATREGLITKGIKFAGRDTQNYAFGYLTRGFNDIAFADYGTYWSLARKLTHSALRIYGDGLNKLETKIIKQYTKLYARLNEKSDQPVDLPEELGLTVLNVICSKVFNHEYDIDEEEFCNIREFLKLQGEGFGSPDIFFVGFMPWLRFFPSKCLRKFKQAMKIRDAFIGKYMLEHEQSFDPQNIRDFTDSLLNALRDEKMSDSKGVNRINRVQLEMIVADIFFGGFETTWKTIHWCFLYLLHWPKYQDLLHQEIVDVLGEKRYPTLEDRRNLPLVQAVIQETLRLSSVGLFTLYHKAIEDDSIDGKPIPKDTTILFNLWSIHHDEKEWCNPDDFDPYRWIDGEGKFSPETHRSFLPFSAGRRVCLGESMAKTEIFVLLTRIVRDFKISANLNQPFPSLVGEVRFIHNPSEFTVFVTPRN